jgi:F-box protein, helicase, 18
MSLTDEQAAVVNYLKESDKDELVLVNAIAGAGKTYLLTQIAKQVPHTQGIYLAYNKSVATEAQEKFPSSISCSTIHSLAYRATVRPYGLKVGSFTFGDIKERLQGSAKSLLIESIREFCLSKYTCADEYAEALELPEFMCKMMKIYMEKMYKGEIECTHDFYLKVFHIGLADGSIEHKPVDILMIDEAGDINAVTLEIFKLIPARIKLAVGDSSQNIYSFNNTINAFTELKEGTRFSLTQSFRVADRIANQIHTFCKKHLNEDFVFRGIPVEDDTISSYAYIARTNGSLIAAMYELQSTGTAFNLVRKASDIFQLPLMLCFLKYQGEITTPGYKHLQKDVDNWYEDTALKKEFPNLLLYLLSVCDEDIMLASAARLVMSKGKTSVLGIYEYAKSCEKKPSNVYLATAHSVKGLEFDSVVILDDLNSAVEKVIDEPGTPEYEQEMNLYYVACSRARKSLQNARWLRS